MLPPHGPHECGRLATLGWVRRAGHSSAGRDGAIGLSGSMNPTLRPRRRVGFNEPGARRYGRKAGVWFIEHNLRLLTKIYLNAYSMKFIRSKAVITRLDRVIHGAACAGVRGA